MRILEVNDNDIYGKVFNGYDIVEYFRKTTMDIRQVVLHKFSSNDLVLNLFDNCKLYNYENRLHELEKNVLSVQSMLSFNNFYLYKNDFYKKADLIHYHQIHNSHFNLYDLYNEMRLKPTIITLHDPWILTGRCVHPMECNKWKKGCENCKYLNTLFSFKEDNSMSMWKIKSLIKDTDIDVIVSSKFMLNMVKDSPYLNRMRIHLLPFGVDLEKYKKTNDKKAIKRELGIDDDSLVLFFREQDALKGTSYIVSALKNLNINKKVTLLTCSEKGLLSDLEEKYEIIELGNIDEQKMVKCYQASDIFLMPSIGESFGMMAIEAMASSLPVVVFDNTALPSVTCAPKIGVLVKNMDSNDLRDKIEFLINNPKERFKRGSLGRKYAEKNYDSHTYYEKLKEIYKTSYNNQKYKLSLKRKSIDSSIDFSSYDSQILLSKLYNISKELGLSKNKIPILKKLNKSRLDNSRIDYSSRNSINIINEFNKEVYLATCTCDKYSKIYNSLLYKKMKKIKILHEPVVFIKKIIQKIK